MGGIITSSVVKRLPRYYRFLGELKEAGIDRTSSRELSKKMGLTASQIRQDLNCFGGFGQQGYGYNVDILQEEIGSILGLDKPKSIILIGVCNLVRAVTMHMNFEPKGFHLVGLFDAKESIVGQIVKNQPVRNIDTLDEFCRENLPSAAILCIPKEAAEKISSQLIKLGVKNFWNFSHYDIKINNDDVKVENVHLGDSLTRLSFKMTNDKLDNI